jgi:hypothetical protein
LQFGLADSNLSFQVKLEMNFRLQSVLQLERAVGVCSLSLQLQARFALAISMSLLLDACSWSLQVEFSIGVLAICVEL